jgi:type II secretory pathway component PulM
MSNEDPPLIGTGMRVASFITKMKPRDLLLLGFIALLVLSIGALTGFVKSPLVDAKENTEMILSNQKRTLEFEQDLLQIARLQLYLNFEACLHDAETPVEVARCNREPVQQAIDDIGPQSGLPATTVSTLP